MFNFFSSEQTNWITLPSRVMCKTNIHTFLLLLQLFSLALHFQNFLFKMNKHQYISKDRFVNVAIPNFNNLLIKN